MLELNESDKVRRAEFRTALTGVLNRYSIDSICNMHDYVLAQLLITSLDGIADAMVKERLASGDDRDILRHGCLDAPTEELEMKTRIAKAIKGWNESQAAISEGKLSEEAIADITYEVYIGIK